MIIDKFVNIANILFGGIMPRAKKATTKTVVKENIVKEGEVGRLVIDALSVMTNSFKQNFDQCPNIFPPKIAIFFGINNDGKNIIQTKITPL